MQRQYIVIGAESGSSMMGVHFRTGGAAPFFGFPISELSGDVVELDLIWKREIGKAQSRLEPDRTVAAALATLSSWPVITLRHVASHLGLSHKQLLARFDCRAD
jgi:hypothetical protein